MPYGISSVLVDYVEEDPGVPVGAWRSVGHSYNVFAVESFIDEVSAALGMNPCEFRRGLLAKTPRLCAALESAARMVSRGQEARRRAYHGVAAYEYLGTYVAMMAEVLCPEGQCPRINRIVCAIDCGIVVNPGIARAQVEGGIAFGLSATIKHKITFRAGRVVERNFDRYEPLRMAEMPSVDVHFVDSDAPPTGLGEAATPGVAPAVCNALYAATGKRFRSLPVDLAGCSASG
jgi:CO/xanthine dehydrogenase Mo-binding subunit